MIEVQRESPIGLFRLYGQNGVKVEQQLPMEELEVKIGYSFQDKLLLKRALTHTSYANEQKINKIGHYERLEFLGDAVLELLCSDFIFHKFDNMEEGKMTKMRASLVCEVSLAKTAEQLSIGRYIFLGKGETAMGGRNKDSIVADVVEAVIGALYLDGGLECAKKFVHEYVLKDWQNKQMAYDPKSKLQEMVQQEKLGMIRYVLISETGPEHQKVFECAVKIDNKQMGIGSGANKKVAEQKAAYETLLMLKKQ